MDEDRCCSFEREVLPKIQGARKSCCEDCWRNIQCSPSEDKRAKATGVTGDLARAEMVVELGRGYGGQGQVDSKG
jgi:hypothetical protein